MTDVEMGSSHTKRRPRSSLSTTDLTLFCCLVGSGTVFSVHISSSDTVDDLKKAIKEEISDDYELSARKLALFKVSLPDEDDLVQKVEDAVKASKPLRSTMELIEVFPDKPPKKTIHIAVKVPDDAAIGGNPGRNHPSITLSQQHDDTCLSTVQTRTDTLNLVYASPIHHTAFGLVPTEFMRPPTRVYKHTLLQTVKPGAAPSSLQRLYELAWNDKDRKSLFQPEPSDLEGFQYESLISTAGFDELFMGLRVLITPEYKAALSDAKCWFGGGEIPPTAGEEEKEKEGDNEGEDKGEDNRGGDNKGDGKGDDNKGEDRHVARMNDVEMGLLEEEAAWPINHPSRKIFIVVGTPGVGKSLFLYYILVERLLARLPTCFQTVPAFFTFWCEEGVFRIPLPAGEDGIEIRDAIPANAWFLVDSNKSYPTPGAMLKQVNACVVQAASPRVEHLEWTEKAIVTHYHWFIKPSPLKESLMMRSLNRSEATVEQWKKFFEEYGPPTRLLISYAHKPKIFETELSHKLGRLNFLRLQDILFRTIGDVTQNEVSHWICGIKPSFRRYKPYSTFHTATILQLVKKEYKEQWNEQVRLAYSVFRSHPDTRSPAGHILEDRMHDVLVHGGSWKVVQLTTNDKGRKNNTYQIPEAPVVAWLSISSAGVCIEEQHSVNLTGALGSHWFWDLKVESKLGYYRPIRPNERTLDAYIVNPLDKSVFMIQTTLAKQHDAKQGGSKDLLTKYPGYTFHYIAVAGEQKIEIIIPKEADGIWQSRWCLHVNEEMLFPKQKQSLSSEGLMGMNKG